jgi:hypothetical protein
VQLKGRRPGALAEGLVSTIPSQEPTTLRSRYASNDGEYAYGGSTGAATP